MPHKRATSSVAWRSWRRSNNRENKEWRRQKWRERNMLWYKAPSDWSHFPTDASTLSSPPSGTTPHFLEQINRSTFSEGSISPALRDCRFSINTNNSPENGYRWGESEMHPKFPRVFTRFRSTREIWWSWAGSVLRAKKEKGSIHSFWRSIYRKGNGCARGED